MRHDPAQTFLEQVRQVQVFQPKFNGGRLAADMAQTIGQVRWTFKKQDGIDLLGAWSGTAMKALNAALTAGLTAATTGGDPKMWVPAM